jgi:hypothetical protein
MVFELKFEECSKIQIQMEFDCIFFQNLIFYEIWTIGLLFRPSCQNKLLQRVWSSTLRVSCFTLRI